MVNYLYTLAWSEDAEANQQDANQQNLTAQGLLGESGSAVERLSSQPGTRAVTLMLQGVNADDMAREFVELSESAGYSSLPFTNVDAPSANDGYYSMQAASQASLSPLPGAELIRVEFNLTRVGSRKTHLWAVSTAGSVTLDHPFGIETTQSVTAPETAQVVRWYDPETQTFEPASSMLTEQAEYGGIDFYDTADSTYTNPWLIYDLPYADAGLTDTIVWDDHDQAKLDADDNLQWQYVFDPGHLFDGNAVLDTGRLRVHIDEGAGTLTAERWNDGTSSWDAVSLTPGGWSVADLDLIHLDPARIYGQVLFTDGTQYTALDVYAHRGQDVVAWGVPANESPSLDSALQTWLSPIADNSTAESGASVELVARREVRR